VDLSSINTLARNGPEIDVIRIGQILSRGFSPHSFIGPLIGRIAGQNAAISIVILVPETTRFPMSSGSLGQKHPERIERPIQRRWPSSPRITAPGTAMRSNPHHPAVARRPWAKRASIPA